MHCIIIGTAYPLRGGIAHYNALLASELAKRHKVETITFSRQYPEFLFPGKTQRESSEGIHGSPAPQLIDSINPLNWTGVAKEIRGRSPDLLIFKYWLPFFGPCFGTIARLAKRGSHTKVLFVCDNVLPHERRPFDAAFTRYAFKTVDYFIVQSRAVEKELNEFWPTAVYRMVPHPVYSLFGPPIDKEQARNALGIHAKRILLFFGYVRKYKGLGVLLKALAKASEQIDAHLVVAGEFYDDEQKYRTLINELGITSRVTVNSDYLPNEKVSEYFSAADAVILPYVSATQSGIAQIAFNFGKPVIATDVGGLGEVVHDNRTGFLVPPNDADALARAIVRFYREAREPAFAAAVNKEKENYSWMNFVRNIEELTGWK
jgi:glycosyltransferase involved in cell wall biosynthesis